MLRLELRGAGGAGGIGGTRIGREAFDGGNEENGSVELEEACCCCCCGGGCGGAEEPLSAILVTEALNAEEW